MTDRNVQPLVLQVFGRQQASIRSLRDLDALLVGRKFRGSLLTAVFCVVLFAFANRYAGLLCGFGLLLSLADDAFKTSMTRKLVRDGRWFGMLRAETIIFNALTALWLSLFALQFPYLRWDSIFYGVVTAVGLDLIIIYVTIRIDLFLVEVRERFQAPAAAE